MRERKQQRDTVEGKGTTEVFSSGGNETLAGISDVLQRSVYLISRPECQWQRQKDECEPDGWANGCFLQCSPARRPDAP